MSVLSKSEFFAALKKSCLLSSRQFALATCSADAIEDVAAIALHLRRLRWLSGWQAEHLLAGKTGFHFGEYVAVDVLGQGAMGSVFKARHRRTGRIVALKLMSMRADAHPKLVERFRREIRLVSSVRHNNVVCAVDAGKVDGRYFLVTEYVRGRNLLTWIQADPALPVGWVCECMRQAALGLEHLHQRGLIHRDIKPANLLVSGASVSEVPQLKILDFGLGRFIEQTGANGQLTSDGCTVGTVDFMSPEQIRDGKFADIRSDIYALGCTFFQALTRRLPFESDQLPEKVTSKLLKDPPRAETHRPDLPGAVGDVVNWMLQRNPAQRPANPSELVKALAPFAMATASPAPSKASASAERCSGDAIEQPLSAANPEPVLASFAQLRRRARESGWLRSLWALLNPSRRFVVSRWNW
jgi:serine/threonine protein kinase